MQARKINTVSIAQHTASAPQLHAVVSQSPQLMQITPVAVHTDHKTPAPAPTVPQTKKTASFNFVGIAG